jgi:hypothetical protein
MFTSKSDQLAQTPQELMNFIKNKFNKGMDLFDPAPVNWDIEKHGDGLKIPWKRVNYINPPFSDARKWLEKGVEESKKRNLSIFLLPCRFHTTYFQDVMKSITCIYILSLPIRFNGYKTPIPVGMCLIVIGPYRHNLKKSLSFAHNGSPYTQEHATTRLKKYSKNFAILDNQVSEPIEKAVREEKDLIMCPSRLNNKSLQDHALKKMKHMIFLHPTFRKNAVKYVDGTLIFVMKENGIVNDEWIRHRIKFEIVTKF